MSIINKKPPLKETVGAQYVCFNVMDENDQWTPEFEESIEQTKVVKSVEVSESTETTDFYASGAKYDDDTTTASAEIKVEVLAFPEDTLAKMRGDNVTTSGLVLSGGRRVRPFFSYGKVVKLKNGNYRYDWYPKCKLVENTDKADTKEDKITEQTDTITIKAYPFNDDEDIVSRVSSGVNAPEGLTEEKFFSKVIMTEADLASVLTVSTEAEDEEEGQV